MKKKLLFVIITIVFIILFVSISVLISKKDSNIGNKTIKEEKSKLYLIKIDNLKHSELSMSVFSGIDSDGRNIIIGLYSNLKCRYLGDENDYIKNRKCYYRIDDDKIIFTLNYPTKYEHTFTIDKDWKYLEDDKGRYDNYLIKYLSENSIEEVLVNPSNFNELYYPDSGIHIFSDCDKNVNTDDSKKCDKDDILELDNYNIIDTKGDFNKIKAETIGENITLNNHFVTRDFDDDYGGEQHIYFYKNNTCKLTVEKNGINFLQDGKYVNCKYKILTTKNNLSISVYADYVEGNKKNKAKLCFYADNKFVDTFGSFDEYLSPSHRKFKAIDSTDYDNYMKEISLIEKIDSDYKLHTDYDKDKNEWWKPVKISECNNQYLDAILKKLVDRYDVEIYKTFDSETVSDKKYVVKIANNDYEGYIILHKNDGNDGYISYLAEDTYVFDSNGDLYRGSIGLLINNVDATVYDVLCKNT